MMQSHLARRVHWSRMGLGLTILLGVTLGSVLILRGSPSTADCLAAALLTGVGTLAMAWLFTGPSGYPRWAMLGSAAAVSAGLVISVAFAPSASAWADGAGGMRWMIPWYYMVLGSVVRRPGTGVCSPGNMAAGWMLVGIGVLFGLAMLVVPALMTLLRG